MPFDHASGAIRGARAHQEDACTFAVAPDGGEGLLLAVLADGMGGHVGGARASDTACRAFVAACMAERGHGVGDGECVHGALLREALAASNRALGEETARDRSLEGMGCTMLAALFAPDGLRWISVGDSPLYLFRDGALLRLNEDHSLAPLLDQMVAQGEMRPEEALAHPQRHALRSALTGGEIELVDLHDAPLALGPEDWVIVASDGIHTLDDDAIAARIAASAGGGAEAVVAALLAGVEEMCAPYQDNTTVMAVRPQPAG